MKYICFVLGIQEKLDPDTARRLPNGLSNKKQNSGDFVLHKVIPYQDILATC